MPQNLFTHLRLFLAFCVALEHIFYFQAGRPYSLIELGHTSPAYFAVNGFFIISGFLITSSAVRSGTLLVFVRSRVLRIMPALIAGTLILGLVVSPLLGEMTLAAYYSTGGLWSGMLGLATFVEAKPEWPGLVMAGNPFAGDLTGPIWTLRHEALAYVGTGLLLFLGLHRNKMVILSAAIVLTGAFALDLQTGLVTEIARTLGALVRFSTCYLYGVCAYLFAGYLKLGWRIALLGMAAGTLGIAAGLPVGEIVFNLAFAPFLFAIAFAKAASGKWGSLRVDYSYGLYIFHWPVYQILLEYFPGASVFPLLFFIGLPLAMLAAAFSWHFIEKPALKLKATTAPKPAKRLRPA